MWCEETQGPSTPQIIALRCSGRDDRVVVTLAFFPEPFAQIFVAGIGEDGREHCVLIFLKSCSNVQTSHYRRSSRNPNQQSFFTRQSYGNFVSIFGCNS